MKCKYPINRPAVMGNSIKNERQFLDDKGLWRVDQSCCIVVNRGENVIVVGHDNYDGGYREGELRETIVIIIAPQGCTWCTKYSISYIDEIEDV